jgi:NADPH:quinone reductase-like Zn-dependent oxidoreductase
VFGLCPLRGPGSHADLVCVPERNLALAPSRASVLEAAALPLAGLTAMQAVEAAELRDAERVLVLGGSGGVGSLIVQYARHLGAQVYASAGAGNLDYLRGLGATAIDYRRERIEDSVPELDVVFDCVGGDTERRSFELLRRGGRLISITGPDPDAEVNVRNVARLAIPATVRLVKQRAQGRRYRFISTRVDHASLVALATLVDRRVLDVRVDRCFPLEQLAEAQRIGELGAARGKLVIDHRAGGSALE